MNERQMQMLLTEVIRQLTEIVSGDFDDELDAGEDVTIYADGDIISSQQPWRRIECRRRAR